MKIVLAKNIGFCFGVKRAYDMCLKAVKEKPAPYYILGPLVHNEKVVKRIEKLGIKMISSIDEANKGTLIISAHGAGPEVFQKAKEKNLEIVDTTCPLVIKVQNSAKVLQNEGYQVIIIGDKGHTEVKSINKAIRENGIIIDREEAASQIKTEKPLGVVIQTTQNPERVKRIVKRLRETGKEVKVLDTLCPVVVSRQKELIDLTKKVDLVLVLGSKTSANTMRMVEIAKELDAPVNLVEDKNFSRELLEKISQAEKVGVVSGTSTPDWLIEEIVEALKTI